MHVCMYACMYGCMNGRIDVCIHMQVCVYSCTYVCMFACIPVCICICVCICMHVCMYVCMHVCMYVCRYTCMHTCTMYYAMYVCIRSLHMHVLLCTCARICVSNVFEAMRVRILYVRVWTQVTCAQTCMHATRGVVGCLNQDVQTTTWSEGLGSQCFLILLSRKTFLCKDSFWQSVPMSSCNVEERSAWHSRSLRS